MRPISKDTLDTLLAIQRHLHGVIRGRAGRFIDHYAVPLPSLASMFTGEASDEFHPINSEPEVWFFRVPGMYGGFRCRWMNTGSDAKLETVSFCRVAGGSGQRHEITSEGSVLVESGFM